MTRIPLQTVESAPAVARPILETAQKNSGYLSNLLGLLANAPAALETYMMVSALNAKTSLTPRDREVVQMIAATTHGCTFCVAGHTALAQNKVQLAPEVTTALRAQESLPDARYEALAQFTREVIARRGNVGESDYQNFLSAGYTQQQALEVILGVSLATLCNFANSFAHTPLNPELDAYRWEASR
jgi:uncharacterized peroxidase-related enzyme